MTRSILSPHSPEVAKKTFRANAKAQGITFKAAAEARNLLPKEKAPIAPGTGRRAHGWMEGTVWNGTAYIDLGEYTDGNPVCGSDEVCGWCAGSSTQNALNADGQAPETPSLPSLLDVAKPAKVKGIAKDFEVIESVKKVIALNDVEEKHEEFRWEDDWEDVYGEEGAGAAKKISYAAVVMREDGEVEDGS